MRCTYFYNRIAVAYSCLRRLEDAQKAAAAGAKQQNAAHHASAASSAFSASDDRLRFGALELQARVPCSRGSPFVSACLTAFQLKNLQHSIDMQTSKALHVKACVSNTGPKYLCNLQFSVSKTYVFLSHAAGAQSCRRRQAFPAFASMVFIIITIVIGVLPHPPCDSRASSAGLLGSSCFACSAARARCGITCGNYLPLGHPTCSPLSSTARSTNPVASTRCGSCAWLQSPKSRTPLALALSAALPPLPPLPLITRATLLKAVRTTWSYCTSFIPIFTADFCIKSALSGTA